MDKISHQELNQILGIYPPFKISGVSLQKEDQSIRIKLINTESPKKGFFQKGKDEAPTYAWQHLRIGRFDTFVEIDLCDKTNAKIHETIPPAFLGNPDRKYTHQLLQTVLFGLNKGVEASVLSTLVGIDATFVSEIKNDYINSEDHSSNISNLPPNTDPIWSNIIKDEIQLKTKNTALNMLITRLQLAYLEDSYNLQKSCELLFSFFAKQKSLLLSELNQLGITPVSTNNAQAKRRKNLVLKIDHPIWDQLLSGKMSIASRHVGLNLKIPSLRSQYANADADVKKSLIIQLIGFLKKNKPSLEVEFEFIRKIAISMTNKDSDESLIPSVDHRVWGDILKGALPIESAYHPFNLFLTSLKFQEHNKVNALLHRFVLKNSSFMIDEIETINKYSNNINKEAVKHA